MERDHASFDTVSASFDFNPRAPHGARLPSSPEPTFTLVFQSTRSAWSATCALQHGFPVFLISIHALRMERDAFLQPVVHIGAISIHALRMERDGLALSPKRTTPNFNPRAPHGARPKPRPVSASGANFNPRAPHGARPLPADIWRMGQTDFNPRAPHGARPP